MSGYFARLSAQLHAPATGPAHRAAPLALEQEAEVSSPMSFPEPGAASRPGTPATTLDTTTPQPMPSKALEAILPVTAEPPDARRHRVPETAAHEIARPSAQVHAASAGRESSAIMSRLAPREAPSVSVTRPARIDDPTAPKPDTMAPVPALAPEAHPHPVRPTRTERALPDPPVGAQAMAAAVAWAEPSAFIAPAALSHAAEGPPGHPAPRPGPEPRPLEHIEPGTTTVRIGTITLEVHPPAATAPSAPRPVAVTSPPAPSQFSLRRHHLRWG